METYAKMHTRQQQEVNALPIGYAFSNEQFAEMMRGWGLDAEKDLHEICKLGYGGFCKKTDVPHIKDTLRRHAKEQEDAIAADKTGEGFIYQMFLTELENHEFCITMDVSDALSACGLSEEDVNADPRISHGLALAMRRASRCAC